MKTKFFNPNWSAINKAIADNKESRDELRKAQRELKEKIDAKFEEYYKAEKLRALKEKIATLKALPVGADVYSLVRNFTTHLTDYNKIIPFGSKGKKIKDGRKFMTVEIRGKKWQIDYERLSIAPLTETDMANYKVSKQVTELVFGK